VVLRPFPRKLSGAFVIRSPEGAVYLSDVV